MNELGLFSMLYSRAWLPCMRNRPAVEPKCTGLAVSVGAVRVVVGRGLYIQADVAENGSGLTPTCLSG